MVRIMFNDRFYKSTLYIIIRGHDPNPGLSRKDRDEVLYAWSESPELAGSVIMLDELHDGLIAEKPGLLECIDLEWSDLEVPTTETTQ